jgi:hypothetical protein
LTTGMNSAGTRPDDLNRCGSGRACVTCPGGPPATGDRWSAGCPSGCREWRDSRPTGPYDVDVPAMLSQRHGWGIHALPARGGPGGGAVLAGAALVTTKVPSVYETEGTSPDPPGPDIRVNRRLPAASRVPEWPPDDARFQTVKLFLSSPGGTCKVLREFISSFFAVHIPSTEDGGLSAYHTGFPPVYAQLIHRFRG